VTKRRVDLWHVVGNYAVRHVPGAVQLRLARASDDDAWLGGVATVSVCRGCAYVSSRRQHINYMGYLSSTALFRIAPTGASDACDGLGMVLNCRL